MSNGIRGLAALGGIFVLVSSTFAKAPNITTVILSDEAPPGGGRFLELKSEGDRVFKQAIVNSDGLVAFLAVLQEKRTDALYCGRAGSVNKVASAREGLFAERRYGANGHVRPVGFHPIQLSDTGCVVFQPTTHTLYLDFPEWASVIRPWRYCGERASPLRAIGANAMVLSSLKRKTILSRGGFIVVNDWEERRPFSIWAGQNADLKRIIGVGDAAPDAGAGVNLADFNREVQVAANGTLAFRAWMSGTGVTKKSDTGIWTGPPDRLRVVALEGEPIPGMADSKEVFQELGNVPIAVNSSGEVAFIANRKLFVGRPGDLRILATENENWVGARSTRRVDLGGNLVIDDDGIISLTESKGIWIGCLKGGFDWYPWEDKFKEGDEKQKHYRIQSMCFTPKRRVACTARLGDGTLALLAGRLGDLKQVVTAGMEIEVRPGDRRKIDRDGIVASFEDGPSSLPINDRGAIVVRLVFSPTRGVRDRSEGLFVVNTVDAENLSERASQE